MNEQQLKNTEIPRNSLEQLAELREKGNQKIIVMDQDKNI